MRKVESGVRRNAGIVDASAISEVKLPPVPTTRDGRMVDVSALEEWSRSLQSSVNDVIRQIKRQVDNISLKDGGIDGIADIESRLDGIESSKQDALQIPLPIEIGGTGKDSPLEIPDIDGLVDALSGKSPIKNMVDMDAAGCVGNDIFDNRSIIRTQILAGQNKVLQFGVGTYRILIDAIGLGNLPSGITIRGAGRGLTTLKIYKTTATFAGFCVFSSSNNVTFEDLTISCEGVNNTVASNMFYVGTCSNVRWSNVRLLGQGAATVADNKINLFSLAATSGIARNGWHMEGCEIRGWAYTVLKTNAAASTDSNYSFLRCDFFDNITGHLNINSPLGKWVGLHVTNCKFYNQGPYLAGLGHHVATSGVEHIHIASNSFYGTADWEAIHCENLSRYCVISDNAINISSWWSNDTPDNLHGTGIWVNNSTTIPRNGRMEFLSITGNIIHRTYINEETARSGTGISLTIDSVLDEDPARSVIITGNLLRGFRNGFVVEIPQDESLWISSNIIIDCDDGVFSAIDPSYFGSNKWVNCGGSKPERWLS